jgi:hypothetical protein
VPQLTPVVCVFVFGVFHESSCIFCICICIHAHTLRGLDFVVSVFRHLGDAKITSKEVVGNESAVNNLTVPP